MIVAPQSRPDNSKAAVARFPFSIFPLKVNEKSDLDAARAYVSHVVAGAWAIAAGAGPVVPATARAYALANRSWNAR